MEIFSKGYRSISALKPSAIRRFVISLRLSICVSFSHKQADQNIRAGHKKQRSADPVRGVFLGIPEMIPHRHAAERAQRRHAEERGETGEPVRVEKAGADAREQRIKAREDGGADDFFVSDLGAVLEYGLFPDGLDRSDTRRAQRK